MKTNRLINEKSPYLLQHAHNPVDWFPWGSEAFGRARSEDKPIFLSIGYSTCHWCHVMERESFEDAQLAAMINAHFIPIKVDREERPDLDQFYMAFVQATTGRGGWPMTVFLTPDLQPFVGGTYFPPETKMGMPGLRQLLVAVRDAWRQHGDQVRQSADEFVRALARSAAPARGSPCGAREVLDQVLAQASASFDGVHGGFGEAPKFPQPVVLACLLHEHDASLRPPALEMVVRTLRSMAASGIHDHLGGGFHRYSTDERWFLPHFEKMLYDQALLAGVYVDAYQITGQSLFSRTARDILDYVLRDLTGPEGQFYSAQDADSAIGDSWHGHLAPVSPGHPAPAGDPMGETSMGGMGEQATPHPQSRITAAAQSPPKAEGRFYVWTATEIRELLGPDEAKVFAYVYGVTPGGNVQEDPYGEFEGCNVLHQAHTAAEAAGEFGRGVEQIEDLLSRAAQTLLAVRSRRPRPDLDDKTLVAWNGLMISAMARAGAALAEPRYVQAAGRAADFIERRLYDSASSRLTRRWRDGQAAGEAFLEDYAFLIQGLIDLYESDLQVRWLKLALDLQSRQDELFWDGDGGGYFSTSGADKSVPVRMKEDTDGAVPSGNSVAALNLLRLGRMVDSRLLADRAQELFAACGGKLARYPLAMAQLATALSVQSRPPVQIVLAGRRDAPDTQALLREVHSHYLPLKVILAADGAAGQEFLARRVDFMRSVHPLGGKAAAYVCEGFACQAPTCDVKELRNLLASRSGNGAAQPASTR